MKISAETLAFFLSVVVGFCFGGFYDAFRILRISFKNPKWLVFIEDVVFFTVISIITFWIVLNVNNGKLRGFLAVGELLGAVCYFFSLSIIVMKLAAAIINFFRKLASFIFNRILRPIYLNLFKFFKFIGKLIKNIEKNLKNIHFRKKST